MAHFTRKEPQRRNPWTEEEESALLHMRDVLGMQFRDIAQKLGRAGSSISDQYYAIRDADVGTSRQWPPVKDPWPVKIDYAAHNLKMKPARIVNGEAMRRTERSLIGCTAALMAGV